MKKFIITIILLLAEGTIVSCADPPNWTNGTTESIKLSLLTSVTCENPIAIVEAKSGDGTKVTYKLTPNIYGISLRYDSMELHYYLQCWWTTLVTALNSSVSSIDIVVSATNSGMTANKTFTFLLRDRYAPEFQKPLEISLTKCDIYSDGYVIYTVEVTDDDEGDVVTLTITTTGTPFKIRNFDILISNVSALESIFESLDTYTFDIQASDLGSKHTTTETMQITYDRNTACNDGGNTVDNSSGNDNGTDNGDDNGTDNGDDNGFSSLTYNLFIICFLILIVRALLE